MNPKGNGGGTYTMTIDTAKERERVYSDLKVSPFPVQISDYFAALDVIDAKDAGIERLRATVVVLKGAVNWLDALLELIEETSCDPDDPERFDEVVAGAALFGRSARAALSERKP